MTQFATTRWSLILEARGGPETARAALEEICRAYRRPVLAYVRHSGRSANDAEDLTQEFFARLLERRWDANADPARGRFRAFLLTALKRFLLDDHATANARKRGGGYRKVELEHAIEECVAPLSQSPEQVFERTWALTVIERAYARLRLEAGSSGKGPLFERLVPFLGEPAAAEDYRRLGDALHMRPNTVAVYVYRLRLRLRELVREELADQTDGAVALEIELRALGAALTCDGIAQGGTHAAA